MKITAICGSPREGSTLTIVENILNLIKSQDDDIETELIILSRKNIRHCEGTEECIETGECEIMDEMGEVIDTLLESDGFIFASPTYFDNVSGVMKDFMDRTNILTKENKLKGKVAALVATGAYNMNSINKTIENLRSFCNAHEIEVVSYLGAMNNTLGNEVVLNEMAKLADELVKAIKK